MKGEGGGGWGLFKSSACLILWPMVDNFFHFGDQAAGMLHIQMNYKYKRMIFFPNSWIWSHLQLARQSNVFGITSGGLIDLW